MDLRQINYFLLVFEERSFTRAAKKAGIVQPALSMQVRNLESELGVELFERSARGLSPTQHGRRFYDLFAPIAREIDSATETMRQMLAPDIVTGEIRCGCPPTFFKSIVGRMLPAFAATYPSVNVELLEGYSGTLHDWVRSGDLDFAFGTPPSDDTGLTCDRIFEEALVLVCGEPIAGERLVPCDLAAIPNLKLFLPSPPQILGHVLRDHIAAGRIRPVRTIVMDSYLGVLESARNSDWAAIIPIDGVLDEIDGPLSIYPISQPQMAFHWHLIHPTRKPLNAAARLFVDMIAQELQIIGERWRDALAEGGRVH
jgi:DNA-binding transcriptional LysR family regulator